MTPPVLKVTDPPVPILMYHYLGDPRAPEDVPYYVSERNFERQMRLLARQGFTSVSVADVLHHLRGERELPARPVAITFDDGHRSFCSIGSPILEHHGMTATMFVITSREGTAGHLTWEEIAELDRRGHSFQSHGHEHKILTRLDSDGAILQELNQCRTMLEPRLSKPVYAHAYRDGHFDERVKALVKAPGYLCALCSKQGFNRCGADLFELRRQSIRNSHNLLAFEKKTALRIPIGHWAGLLRAGMLP